MKQSMIFWWLRPLFYLISKHDPLPLSENTYTSVSEYDFHWQYDIRAISLISPLDSTDLKQIPHYPVDVPEETKHRFEGVDKK